MATTSEIDSFIKSQRSLQSYDRTREALKSVLVALPDSVYRHITRNLVIVALHEGVLGQAMHFPDLKGDFKVMQLTLPKDFPTSVLCFVIAHELGHVMQGRNWEEGDGKEFETEADTYALSWGFPRTSAIAEYLNEHWKDPIGF